MQRFRLLHWMILGVSAARFVEPTAGEAQPGAPLCLNATRYREAVALRWDLASINPRSTRPAHFVVTSGYTART
jgi:hypothetical protein